MTKNIEKPDVLVDVYGKNPPRAAEFGKGVQTIAEINKATGARVDQRPGDYYRNGKED